jgi:hypothetical protein
MRGSPSASASATIAASTNDGRRQNETALLALHERACPLVPGVASIVVRVDNPGVEKDAHRLRFRVERAARGAAPNPVSVRISSARPAVSARPLSNAPAPGGALRGSRVTYARTASRTISAIGRF